MRNYQDSTSGVAGIALQAGAPCRQSPSSGYVLNFFDSDFGHVLESALVFDHPLEQVFPFFSAAENLEEITPPFLQFRIMTHRPIVMEQGLLIDYRLRFHGIPLHWQSEITVWEPPFCFIDEQKHGPFRFWMHEHLFQPIDDNRTRVIDRVRYALWGGTAVNKLFIQDDLKAIFDFRAKQLFKVFPPKP